MMVQGAATTTPPGYSKHRSTFPMPPLYPKANVADSLEDHQQNQSMDSMSRTLKPYSMSPDKSKLRKSRGVSSNRHHTCKRCAHSQRDHISPPHTPKRKSNRRRSYSSTDSTSSSAQSDSSSDETDSSSYTSYSSSREKRTRGRPTTSQVVRPRQVSLNPLSMYVPSKQQFIPHGAHIHPAVAPYVQPNSIYAASHPATYRQSSQTLQQATSSLRSVSPTHSASPLNTLPQPTTISPSPVHLSLRATADQYSSVLPGVHSAQQPTTFRTNSGQSYALQQGNVDATNTQSASSPQAYRANATAQSPLAYGGGTPNSSDMMAAAQSPQAARGSPTHVTPGSPVHGYAPYHGHLGIPTTVTSPQAVATEHNPVPSYSSPVAAQGGTASEFEMQGTDQYEYSPAARGVYPVGAMRETLGVGESQGGTTGGASLYEDSTQQISQAESAIFLPDFRGRSRGVKKARQGCCG